MCDNKNSVFQSKDIIKYNWIQPMRNLRLLIDYVIAQQRNTTNVLKSKQANQIW